MQSSICTLFEKDYHYGVAALANSLHTNGYKGSVFVGYRGQLPTWAACDNIDLSLEWEGAHTVELDKNINVHFLPLKTDYHLTNYKPDFMIQLLCGPAKRADALFYFDPDVVINAFWSSFEDWVNCGIALCEDVNSPLQEHHPRRVSWRQYFSKYNIDLYYKSSIYVNGGFIGITKDRVEFLFVWQTLQEKMAPAIGGLNRSSLAGLPLPEEAQGFFAPFSKTDQDALNATIEAWNGPVSFVGKEGMGFKLGTVVIPHALGQPKPWNTNYLLQALKGHPPRVVDRAYWNYSKGVVNTHSPFWVWLQKLLIKIAAFIGRFYRRSGIS